MTPCGYWTIGVPGGMWGPGQRSPMATFKKSAAAIMALMPMKFTLHSALAEGTSVLLEVESLSPKPGGGVYNNRYCYVMQIKGEQIEHVREYPDTKYAAEMLPPEAWAHEKGAWEQHHSRYWVDA